jgi:nucleotide-binding universal stress UspA family protein
VSDESNVIVGYEGEPTGRDVMAFAQRWAKAGGDQLTVVTVYQGSAPLGAGHVDAEWVAYGRDEADRLLDEARALTHAGIKARYVRVASGSAAHGLHDLLEGPENDTPLIVLGSRRTKGLRSTYPGSTAERLLQGSPVPVAMVPWGFGETEDAAIAKIAVAYVDTDDGHIALDHAGRMAIHLNAQLEVLTVVPDTRVVPTLGDFKRFAADQRATYQATLDAALQKLPPEVKATTRLLDGPVVDALADIRPEEADVLVCGSRGYGPVRRVLLGGVSSRVLRHARVPVIVVPRG